jgi:cytochrome c biogenesis protein CcmG/thiol:disulfide interchange protein DsbE
MKLHNTTLRLPTLKPASVLLSAVVLMSPAAMGFQSSPGTPSAQAPAGATAQGEVDVKWLERLPKDDRAAIEENVGFAPPAFTSDLKWIVVPASSWNELRGKVVVIQSWTTATTAGRRWPARIAQELKDVQAKDVRILALHTPENAADAEDFMQKQKPPEGVGVIIDPTGQFCDALGIYKSPVNIVVDRHGVVRYAGLNPNGVKQVVAALVGEPFDASKQAPQRPEAKPDDKKAADYPPFKGSVTSAKDIRGKEAPRFFVKDWLTKKPDLASRVVVIDFWATWCGPCVAAIPHMNELAQHFGEQAVFIGISDEKRYDFEEGLRKRKLKESSFKYALALDPAGTMKSAVGVRGIPHCIVMSRDWVVRWQGHPADLSRETLEQIVQADGGLAGRGAVGKGAPSRRSWSAPGRKS